MRWDNINFFSLFNNLNKNKVSILFRYFKIYLKKNVEGVKSVCINEYKNIHFISLKWFTVIKKKRDKDNWENEEN